MSVVANLLLILAAVVTKLSSSIDDVVWLLPFVSATNKRLCMAVTYILVNMVVTIAAVGISFGGRTLFEFILKDDTSYWNAERILALGSGVVLLFYSVYLLYDWIMERKEDSEENKQQSELVEIANVPAQAEVAVTASDETEQLTKEHDASEDDGNNLIDDDEDGEIKEDKQRTVSRLVVVAILGSLDDFAVQVALLLAETFQWYQLLIGVFIGSTIVTIFCLCVGYISCIVKYIERIPIWTIILILAIYTIVSAFVNIE